MSNLAVGVWMVAGGQGPVREHPAVRLETCGPIPDGDAGWDEFVRARAESTRADARPVGAAFAAAGPGRRLAVVVTTDGRDPRRVLDWLLDPTAPLPDAPEDAAVPTAELPPDLRDGGGPSGSASSVRRPGGTAVDQVAAAARVPADAVLAVAVAVVLGAYRGEPATDLLVGWPSPAAVRCRPGNGDRVSDLARRVAADVDVDAASGRAVARRAPVAVRRARPPEPETVGGCTVTPVPVAGGVARHPIEIELTDDGLLVQHDVGLFSPARIERFADRLSAVLDALTPDLLVRDLEVMTTQERADVAAWARGETWPVPPACLHTLVERQAQAAPHAPALACGDRELTYGELDAWADEVAGCLRARSTGRGDLVAVVAERAVESVVAMLGVLKAGAAYVPVEPSYPPERRRWIVGDSGAGLALVRTGEDPALAVPQLALDRLPAGGGDGGPADVGPADLAYVIYTSGSTGVPKGVAVPHRAVVASTRARGIGGPPPERDLVTMPLCFDGAAGGLFWTLTGGGTAVLPTDAEAHDPLALARLMRSRRPTHIHSVPSHYELVLQVADERCLRDLRLVSVGGEPMPPRLVARHLLDHPDALLLNDYGPTECAIWASAHPCTVLDATRGPVPIGRPLPNYRIHVLDAHLRPTPPGLPGELYIGGAGVAWGYHRRPRHTAERFFPDPSGGPGERLYRTGDRGRWTAAGDLQILGRVDNQVKLRGFRVELGEIEAAIRRHRAVTECVVTVRPAASGADVVTAFVESRDPVLGDASLREEAARTLPSYMCPDRFVVLPELPRGPSGKLDAAALRDLAAR